MKYIHIFYVFLLTNKCLGQFNIGEECILIDGPFKNKRVIIQEKHYINTDTIKDDGIHIILLKRLATLTPETRRLITNHLEDFKVSTNNRNRFLQLIPDILTKEPVYKVMVMLDINKRPEIIVDICALQSLQSLKASPE